jgi:hypothetical protein
MKVAGTKIGKESGQCAQQFVGAVVTIAAVVHQGDVAWLDAAQPLADAFGVA